RNATWVPVRKIGGSSISLRGKRLDGRPPGEERRRRPTLRCGCPWHCRRQPCGSRIAVQPRDRVAAAGGPSPATVKWVQRRWPYGCRPRWCHRRGARFRGASKFRILPNALRQRHSAVRAALAQLFNEIPTDGPVRSSSLDKSLELLDP